MTDQKLIKPQTLKGFRDFLPEEANIRNYVIEKFRNAFEKYGYDPLETPALEYADVLLGKYGEEADKLLYIFEDRGGRKVGLRYDQTVPLSRVIAQYQNIPKPFKRFQIQPVWRADNPQSGRFREFMQCDIDIVGTSSPLADAEIIDCTLAVCKKLGFNGAQMRINDRSIFDQIGLTKTAIISLDKLEKIGKENVLKELKQKNIDEAEKIFTAIESSPKTERLENIFSALKTSGLKEGEDFIFDRFLARGLDYYTSTVFELKLSNYQAGSLAGGGRYDNLIGSFIGTDVPAVGIAFGFDRIIEALRKNNLLPNLKSSTKVLVAVFSRELLKNSLRQASDFRSKGINVEVYLDPDTRLDKQLKYADQKGIPFVVIIGPDEVKNGTVTVKNMKTKEQKTFGKEELIKYIQ